jgi:phosphoribosylformimino-5-aminoimidazole carboxamide ribotide isomerase
MSAGTNARSQTTAVIYVDMLIIPAIDLKDGCVVRYVQGRRDKKVYSKDPVKTAKHWQRQGAKLIHVVDLDGAATGKLKNLDIVKQIIKTVEVPVEFGGGIRKQADIKKLLTLGVFRVVLGTKAIQDQKFLKKAFQEFKHRIIVSLDIKAGKLCIKGWRNTSWHKGALKFCQALKAIGFKQIIYTDVLKDGTLSGPNIKGLKKLLKETGIQVIASGGISSLADIFRLKLLENEGLVGVIVGKALYEGKFTLSEAIKLIEKGG